jgi:hypothetical protein
LLKCFIIFPRRQFGGCETVCQLVVSHQRPISFLDAEANQGNSQIIGEEANGGQDDPLLPGSTVEKSVNLVYDQHVH